MRWGLIPYWAKDASFGNKAINAVSETAAEKAAFREPLRKRRCLVPANGFYEWKQVGPKRKQAYHIGLPDDQLFAFAGLWDKWKEPSGKLIESVTILTTAANAIVNDIHSRMPVILQPDDYDMWLDPGVTDPARVSDLLRPFDGRWMRLYPVGSRVNKVENEGPECAQEIPLTDDAPEQATLF